jgi:hypothetical protein
MRGVLDQNDLLPEATCRTTYVQPNDRAYRGAAKPAELLRTLAALRHRVSGSMRVMMHSMLALSSRLSTYQFAQGDATARIDFE